MAPEARQGTYFQGFGGSDDSLRRGLSGGGTGQICGP